MTDNATLCPVCGKELISLCKTSIPPIYESYCPNCQYSRRESSNEVGIVKLVTAMPDLSELLKENRVSDRGLEDFLKILDRDFRYKRENGIDLYDLKELVLYELVARELERSEKKDGGDGDA